MDRRRPTSTRSESARADVPIPDELIAKATASDRKRARPFPPLFFKNKRRASLEWLYRGVAIDRDAL